MCVCSALAGGILGFIFGGFAALSEVNEREKMQTEAQQSMQEEEFCVSLPISTPKYK